MVGLEVTIQNAQGGVRKVLVEERERTLVRLARVEEGVEGRDELQVGQGLEGVA